MAKEREVLPEGACCAWHKLVEGQVVVHKKKGAEKKRFRYKPEGLRRRRNFRGNTITQDTRQINLKVVETGNKDLATILSSGDENAAE